MTPLAPLRFTVVLTLALFASAMSLNVERAVGQITDYPEAVAVEDITYLGCEITDVTYEWNGEGNFDKPIEIKRDRQ